MSKLQSMCLKKFPNHILILIKFCLFFIFGHWAKRNRPKLFRKNGQNCFLDSLFSRFQFNCWAQKDQSFAKKFSAGLSKLHFTCPKKPFEKKNTFVPKAPFWTFWDVSENFFGSDQKISRQDCQNCNLCA